MGGVLSEFGRPSTTPYNDDLGSVLRFGSKSPENVPPSNCRNRDASRYRGSAMGSLIKKRRKRMRKKKHRKMLKRTRAQRQRGK